MKNLFYLLLASLLLVSCGSDDDDDWKTAQYYAVCLTIGQEEFTHEHSVVTTHYEGYSTVKIMKTEPKYSRFLNEIAIGSIELKSESPEINVVFKKWQEDWMSTQAQHEYDFVSTNYYHISGNEIFVIYEEYLHERGGYMPTSRN